MVRTTAAWTADLVCLLALVAVADVLIVVAGVTAPFVRIALLAPLVLLGPGYALVAVLYPERRVPGPTDPAPGNAAAVAKPSPRHLPPTVAGRVGLAVAASLVIVPALALFTVQTGGLSAERVLLGISAVTAGGALLALSRRAAVEPESRFSVAAFHPGVPFGPRRSRIGRSESGRGRVANLALAVGVVALVVATAFAATAMTGSSFTEFYVGTHADSGFTASDYPRDFPADAGKPVVARVGNHEGHDQSYTVVLAVQHVRSDGSSLSVVDQRVLDSQEVTVGTGDTASVRFTPDPGPGGNDRRLVFLLYRGDAPSAPSMSSAYRVVHYAITGGR